MKKALMVFGFALLFFGCQQDELYQEDTHDAQEQNFLDKRGNQDKVWICHRTENGSYNLIHVSVNALKAHRKHGDVIDVVYSQDFESNADNWFDSNNGWYGTVTRVASGTNGISAASGEWYAQMEGGVRGPFSRFDGFKDTWTGTYRAEVDIYLDPSWGTSQGFDYSVASNKTTGEHLRDFIFHVNKDASTGKLLVGGSNNSNFAPREDLETLLNHYEVTTAGWYKFQHVFYDKNGSLAVDLNLLDSSGTILFTETRHTATDLIDEVVGGNRYAWFTFINVEGGIAVDNHSIYRGCAS